MKQSVFICAILILLSLPAFAQRRINSLLNTRMGWRGPTRSNSSLMRKNWENNNVTITKRTDGYLVYKEDTIRGLVILSEKEVQLEKPIDSAFSAFYIFHLNNTDLKTIMIYNTDKKPLCLTRATEKDKRMLRLVHSGKLNIYDDRIAYVYNPKDIDKNFIIISYDGVVDNLSSFLTENTKRDLIGYVNDIYGLKIDPKTISWQDLLAKVDMLD